jgi:hypothetical protein
MTGQGRAIRDAPPLAPSAEKDQTRVAASCQQMAERGVAGCEERVVKESAPG